MPAIEARALRKDFGGLVAVNEVRFEVADGENFALLDPNGAGKSTLIRLLTTLLAPTAGTALVAGHDVLKDPDAVGRSIGVVPQGLTSDPELTAAENLDFCAKLHRVPQPKRGQLVEQLPELIQLSQWRDNVGVSLAGMIDELTPATLVVLFAFGVLVASALVSVVSLLVVRVDDPTIPRVLFGLLNTLLFFPSGAVYPISSFPRWMQLVSKVDPFTYAVHGFRSLLLKGIGVSAVLGDVAVLAGLTTVCMAGVPIFFRRRL